MLPFLFYPLLTSFNGQSIVYNNGYPTTYKGKSLTWSRGKLVTYNNGYGTNFNYTYDVNGRKTKVERGTNEICYFFYDGDKLVAEHWYTPSGTTPFVKVHYLYDDQGIVGFKAYKNGENNNNYEYFTVSTDILGNVIRIDNANGWVTKIAYDAFGTPTYTNNSNNTPAVGSSATTFFKLAYKGYYYDPDLKLYYLMSRYYDPETGRFISPDHINYFEPQALLGTNLYAYCKNNPIMYSDTAGHFAWLALLINVGLSLAFEVLEDATDGNGMDHDFMDYLGAGISGALSSFGKKKVTQAILSIGGEMLGAKISGDLEKNGFASSLISATISTGTSMGIGAVSKYITSKIKASSLKKLAGKAGNNAANKKLAKMGITKKIGSNAAKEPGGLAKIIYKQNNWIGNILSENIGGSIGGGIASIAYEKISNYLNLHL